MGEHPFGTLLSMEATRFDDLIEVDVDGLSDAAVTDHLLAVHALKARVEGALIAATGAFDRRMLHTADAARTAAGWLTARVDQTRSQCGHDVQHARTLRSMPVVEAAFRAGRIGRAKVNLLAETRTDEIAEVFAEQEAYLVGEVADLRVTDAGRFLRAWHQAARLYVGSIDPDEPVEATAPRVAVNLAQTFDGRYVLDGEMDAEHGAIVRGAIDAEVDETYRVGIFGPDGPQERGSASTPTARRSTPPRSADSCAAPTSTASSSEPTARSSTPARTSASPTEPREGPSASVTPAAPSPAATPPSTGAKPTNPPASPEVSAPPTLS